MNTLQWVVFGVGGLGTAAAMWFGYRGAARRRRVRFQDRPEISEDEFFSTYYAESGIAQETVSEVLREVAKAIEVPAAKLRPSDRFDREFAPVKGWEFDDGLAELAWFVKAKRKKSGVREIEQLHTMDDLIRYVARLEGDRGL